MRGPMPVIERLLRLSRAYWVAVKSSAQGGPHRDPSIEMRQRRIGIEPPELPARLAELPVVEVLVDGMAEYDSRRCLRGRKKPSPVRLERLPTTGTQALEASAVDSTEQAVEIIEDHGLGV